MRPIKARQKRIGNFDMFSHSGQLSLWDGSTVTRKVPTLAIRRCLASTKSLTPDVFMHALLDSFIANRGFPTYTYSITLSESVS